MEGLVVSFAANDARGMARNLIAAASKRLSWVTPATPLNTPLNHQFIMSLQIAVLGSWMWLDT